MNRISNHKLGSIIWILLFCQILYTLFVAGRYVLFRSNLRLWLNPNFYRFQKEAALLGGDYVLSQRFADFPLDANYLVISSDTLWFINYHLFPRKLFWFEGVTKDEDLKKIPKEWLQDKKIEYVIFYHLPDVRIIRLEDLRPKSEVK
jgi:hypothetical protein